MKRGGLTKTHSNESYSKVRIGKNLPEAFPIKNVLKQGDGSSPSLFKFALDIPS
jgi:hypothetical protein